MNTKEILHQKIYKIITEICSLEQEVCHPDTIINIGKYGVAGEDAEDLLNYIADSMDIPREYIYNNFSYSLYFDKEINPFLAILLPFVIIYQLILLIYQLTRNCLRLLLKHPTLKYKINSSPPLTAEHFADMMIDILKKYQSENKE